jgi:hypothetical protein
MKRMMHVTTARFGRFRQGIRVARIHDTKLDAYQYGTENLIIKSYIFEHYPLLVWSYGALFDDSYTIAQDGSTTLMCIHSSKSTCLLCPTLESNNP